MDMSPLGRVLTVVERLLLLLLDMGLRRPSFHCPTVSVRLLSLSMRVERLGLRLRVVLPVAERRGSSGNDAALFGAGALLRDAGTGAMAAPSATGAGP